jgi:hypothetical protein
MGKICLFPLHQQRCSSPAATASRPQQRPGHLDQVPAKNNERRCGHRPRHHGQVPAMHSRHLHGQRPGHHAQLPARRRGQRPGETLKYLRRTTSAAAGNVLGTTINEYSFAMHSECRRGKRPGLRDQVPATHNERRLGQRPGATTKNLR